METNKQVVLKVLKGSFIERDATVVDRYFSPDYVQHNPVIPNGPRAIANLIPTLKTLSYEIGMVVAEGDLVMVHGRYVGWGPKPLVAVDIFKEKNGKVAGDEGKGFPKPQISFADEHADGKEDEEFVHQGVEKGANLTRHSEPACEIAIEAICGHRCDNCEGAIERIVKEK